MEGARRRREGERGEERREMEGGRGEVFDNDGFGMIDYLRYKSWISTMLYAMQYDAGVHAEGVLSGR